MRVNINPNDSVYQNTLQFRNYSPREIDEAVFELAKSARNDEGKTFRAAIAAKICHEQRNPLREQNFYLSSSLHARRLSVQPLEAKNSVQTLPCFVAYQQDPWGTGCLHNLVYVFVVPAAHRQAALEAKALHKTLEYYGDLVAGGVLLKASDIAADACAFPLTRLGEGVVLVSWTADELKKARIQLIVEDADNSYSAYRMAQVMQSQGLAAGQKLSARVPDFVEHRVDLRPKRDEYYFLTQVERDKFNAAYQLVQAGNVEQRLTAFDDQIKAALIEQAKNNFAQTNSTFAMHSTRVENFNDSKKNKLSKYVALTSVKKKDDFSVKAVPLEADVLGLFPQGHAVRKAWDDKVALQDAQQYCDSVDAAQRALAALLREMENELADEIAKYPEILSRHFRDLPFVGFTTAAKTDEGQVQFAGTLNRPEFYFKREQLMKRMNGALEHLNLRFCITPAEQDKFCQQAAEHLQAAARRALTAKQAKITEQVQASGASFAQAAASAAAKQPVQAASAATIVSASSLLSLILTNYDKTTSWHKHETGVYRSDFVQRLVKYLQAQGSKDVTLIMLRDNLVETSCFPCRLFGDAKRSKLRERVLLDFTGSNKDAVLKNLEQDDKGELVRASDRVLSAVLGKF